MRGEILYFVVIMVLAHLLAAKEHREDDECLFAMGSDVYDLSPMKFKHAPLVYKDDSMIEYKLTICNSFPLLEKCRPIIRDVVASKECEVYGKGSGILKLINDTDPDYGIIITYKGGSICHNRDEGKFSVELRVECDLSVKNPPDMLKSVKSDDKDKCKMVYTLKSVAGCPIAEEV